MVAAWLMIQSHVPAGPTRLSPTLGTPTGHSTRFEFARPLMQRLFLPFSRPIPSPCKGHITVVGDQPGFLMFVR
jgi:hypothetical protein